MRARLGFALSSLDLGDEQDHLEQHVEVLLLLGRDFDHDRLSAPLFGDETKVGELALDPFRVGLRLVDLVDRDEDRNTGRFGVVDRLLGLRHHAVVGGHDQDDDVGDARAARAHHRERFVARRVEEDDVARSLTWTA